MKITVPASHLNAAGSIACSYGSLILPPQQQTSIGERINAAELKALRTIEIMPEQRYGGRKGMAAGFVSSKQACAGRPHSHPDAYRNVKYVN